MKSRRLSSLAIMDCTAASASATRLWRCSVVLGAVAQPVDMNAPATTAAAKMDPINRELDQELDRELDMASP